MIPVDTIILPKKSHKTKVAFAEVGFLREFRSHLSFCMFFKNLGADRLGLQKEQVNTVVRCL
jgi:hypothetical protein